MDGFYQGAIIIINPKSGEVLSTMINYVNITSLRREKERRNDPSFV